MRYLASGESQAVSDWRIPDRRYRAWIDNIETSALAQIAASPDAVQARGTGPLISIILPVFNTPIDLLTEALESICSQSYARWELCVVDDASTVVDVRRVLERYQAREPRIRLQHRAHNGGISRTSNDALAMASGEYVALMDHDDVIAPHALLLVAMAVLAHPGTRLLYTDSDDLDSEGRRCNPFFKPDWNDDLLLGQNYFNHLTVYSSALLRELGGFREAFDASQDYDLALRAVEQLAGHEIRHIPHVLYHWRVVEDSVARANLGRACQVARMAVAEHLLRTGQAGEVVPAEKALIFNRVVRPTPQPGPGITVVVYGEEPAQLAAAAGQLREREEFRAIRIETATVIPGDGGAASELNSLCLSVSTPFIGLLHASARVLQADFFAVLQAHLSRPGVAAAGAQLVALASGLACGPLRAGVGESGLAPACPGAASDSKGYFAGLCLEQDASVLHGAALALSTASFRAAGGVSAGLCQPLFVGADICLKLAARGERIIWTPYAKVDCPPPMLFTEAGPESVGEEAVLFDHLWHEALVRDPFYNPNFDTRDASYRLAMQG